LSNSFSKSSSQDKRTSVCQASTTDADAQFMRPSDHGLAPAYNVQLVGDAHSKLIVNVAVSKQLRLIPFAAQWERPRRAPDMSPVTSTRKLKEIDDRLLSTTPESLQMRLEDVRTFVTVRLANLRGVLYADVAKARAALAEHITEVRMLPQTENGKRHYVAEGEWNLLGGCGKETGRFGSIAGVGFEPTTFGL
jgi:hypothetical protein